MLLNEIYLQFGFFFKNCEKFVDIIQLLYYLKLLEMFEKILFSVVITNYYNKLL